jgi:hypothetical protein
MVAFLRQWEGSQSTQAGRFRIANATSGCGVKAFVAA